MDRIAELDHAIATLEAQRAVLGDAVVDTALQPLLERRAEEVARAAGEQRKLVTVLFSDLVGFTSMSESMDVEDVRAALDAYFARWRDAIADHGGVVEKYIGDAVMAVFGLHRAQEDDAERAIRTALAVRDALPGLNADLGPAYGVELAMRVGIDTGDVVVSTLDDRPGQDFVVVGEIVNRSSRIQSAAPRDGILISHDTYRHVRGTFRLEPVEPLRLKGVAEPVPAYLVQGARTRTFRVRTRGVEGLETRTVGRDLELRRLHDLFWEVVEDRRSRIVTVVGEAGVGKSRLLFDFENWVDLLPESVRYFAGRAVPASRNQPNGLLRDLVAFRFQVQDSDPPATVRAKVEEGFAEVLGDDPAGRTKAHLVAGWLGFELGDLAPPVEQERDGRAVRDRAVAHLAEYFAKLTDLDPVVVLLEDLHWADDTSLDWIDALAPALAERPVLVVATARPSLFEHRPHWGEGLEYHTRLHVEPLTRRESRALLLEILQRADRVPESLHELVVSAAEGNPFYIEELVKWLVEEGVVETGEASWTVHEDRLAALRVPPTLKGVLQARLDALATEERLLLQRASVIGRVFWDEAVEHLGEGRGALAGEVVASADVLHRLRRREVIYQRERSSFDRTAEFVFKHALLRDVTYDSVLRSHRRAYHGLAAQWLEQITEARRRADEYAAAIAEHYDQAGDTALAARWYVRAGTQASRLWANGEACRLLDRAVELAGDDPALRFDALVARETVVDRMGDRAAQARDVEAMEALVPALDPGRRARLLIVKAKVAFFQSRYDDQHALAADAVDLSRQAGSVDLESLALLWWGKGLTWQGVHEEARRRLEEAIERARVAGDLVKEGEGLRYLAIVASNVSEFPKALELLDRARDVHRRAGDQHGESQAVAQMATVFYNMGDYASAREYLEQAIPVFQLIGYRYAEALATSNLAIIAFGQGRYGEAERRLEEAVRLAEDLDDREGMAISLEMLGDLARCVGDTDAAESRLARALELAPSDEFPYLASDALLLLGLVALDTGRVDDGLRRADEALEAAHRAESPLAVARAHVGRGYALLAAGRPDDAAAAFRDAERVQDEIGLGKARHEALAGQAAAALAAGRQADAAALVAGVLDHLTADDLEGTLRPGEVIWTCWRALCEVGDPRVADVARAADAFLATMAERIDDDDLRDRYLRRPVIRRLADLAG